MTMMNKYKKNANDSMQKFQEPVRKKSNWKKLVAYQIYTKFGSALQGCLERVEGNIQY